jgi:hypothetical protein
VPVSAGVSSRGPLPSAADEEQVHPAHLLDPAALDRVEPDDLVAALLGGLALGEQAAGVVAGALGLAGAAHGRPDVLVGQPDRHRLDLTGEERQHGEGDQQEQVLVGGAHAHLRLGGDHERPQVQALPLGGGHPVAVDLDEGVDGVEEQLLGQLGHGEAGGRAVEALGVLLRPEDRDAAVGLPVGLEALEDGLPVVQHHRRRVELQRRVGGELRVVPALVDGPADRDHVVGVDAAEAGVGHERLALGVAARAGAAPISRRSAVVALALMCVSSGRAGVADPRP